jgi:hypothetical protein
MQYWYNFFYTVSINYFGTNQDLKVPADPGRAIIS